MMTRESVIQGMTNNVRKQIEANGWDCVRVRTRLCELRDFVYTIEDGVLCCYILDEDGMHGDRADALSNGQLYTFVDELLAIVERSAHNACDSVRHYQAMKARADVRRILCN